MNSEDVSGALPCGPGSSPSGRAAEASPPSVSIPNAAALGAWLVNRMTSLREERRDALVVSDEYSAACATGAMLELYELQSFLIASGMSAGTAETRSGSGLQPASPVGNAETPKPPSE